MSYVGYTVTKKKWKITDKYACASVMVMSLCPNDLHDSDERRYKTALTIYSIERSENPNSIVSLRYSNDRYLVEVDGEVKHEQICREYVRPSDLYVSTPEGDEQSKLNYLRDLWWEERDIRREIFLSALAILHDLIWKEIPLIPIATANATSTDEELRLPQQDIPAQPNSSSEDTVGVSQGEVYQSDN